MEEKKKQPVEWTAAIRSCQPQPDGSRVRLDARAACLLKIYYMYCTSGAAGQSIYSRCCVNAFTETSTARAVPEPSFQNGTNTHANCNQHQNLLSVVPEEASLVSDICDHQQKVLDGRRRSYLESKSGD